MAPPAKRAKKSTGGAVPRKTRKVIESNDNEDNAIDDDDALLAKMGELLKGNDPLAFDRQAAPAEQAVRTNFSRTKINGLMHSNNPLAPLAGNAPPFNINIKCNCRDGMTKKATETIVPNLGHNSTHLPAVLPNPMVEYAFPVLEADEEADGPKDIVATLPNKIRLTPLSIMVCDTISAVRSRTVLKVLFDPGLTTTFISRN
jgi:hypothetical protein